MTSGEPDRGLDRAQRGRRAWAWLPLFALLAALWPLPAPARPATIPTSEIVPGMKGYGLTVFRGTQPERFDVEVIDVLHNFRPNQDLVLVRTPHPRLNVTGSVAGMSGSPVYLDGRLAGAYAYGWGFGLEPIAGVTPIANMLHELTRPMRPLPSTLGRPLPPVPATPTPAALGARDAGDPFEPLRRHAAQARRESRPARLTTPLLVGGMAPQAADLLAQHLRPLGLEVLEAGPAGADPHAKVEDASGYQDGGAIGVQLLRGDVTATAVGTVTHVAGDRLIAFGHPMLDGGQVMLPTATARVLHVLASSRSSFKIAEAIAPDGSLVQDRQAAIVVDRRVDPQPVPLRVEIAGVEGLARRTWEMQVARHDLLTVPLVYSGVASALGAALSDQAPAAFTVTSRVQLRDRAPITTVDAGYSEGGIALAGVLLGLKPVRLLSLARHNPFERLDVESVVLRFDVDFGRLATEIVSARVEAPEVDPGATLALVVTLRRLDGPPERRRIELPIARALAGEKLHIDVQPGSEVAPILPRPRSVDDLLAQVTRAFPDRSLVVSVRREARGARLEGHVLHNLPASAVYALAGDHDSGSAAPFATELRSVFPMDTVLTGSASVQVEVRKEPR